MLPRYCAAICVNPDLMLEVHDHLYGEDKLGKGLQTCLFRTGQV